MDGKPLKHSDALLEIINGCQEPGRMNDSKSFEITKPKRPRIGKVFVCGTASDFEKDQNKLLWEKQ